MCRFYANTTWFHIRDLSIRGLWFGGGGPGTNIPRIPRDNGVWYDLFLCELLKCVHGSCNGTVHKRSFIFLKEDIRNLTGHLQSTNCERGAFKVVLCIWDLFQCPFEALTFFHYTNKVILAVRLQGIFNFYSCFPALNKEMPNKLF